MLYKNVVNKIVRFPKNTAVLIIKIPRTIGKRSTIQKCIKWAWKINDSRALKADIVLAVDKGIIYEIFIIDKITLSRVDPRRKRIYTTVITDMKLRIKYIGNLIPKKYRGRGELSPLRYNYDLLKNTVVIK